MSVHSETHWRVSRKSLFFFFFKIFVLMWTIFFFFFKSLLNLFHYVWSFGLQVYGTPASLPGIEPIPPAPGGEVSTTGPLGKSQKSLDLKRLSFYKHLDLTPKKNH